MPGLRRALAAEPSGLLRAVAIVLATVAGALGCWLWVFFLLALQERPAGGGGSAPGDAMARILWFLGDPKLWKLGATCGLWFALPSLVCMWPRRLLPALGFVLAVGYAAATCMIAATWLGGFPGGFQLALPVTAGATLSALVFVRCTSLPIWTRRSGPAQRPA